MPIISTNKYSVKYAEGTLLNTFYNWRTWKIYTDFIQYPLLSCQNNFYVKTTTKLSSWIRTSEYTNTPFAYFKSVLFLWMGKKPN